MVTSAADDEPDPADGDVAEVPQAVGLCRVERDRIAGAERVLLEPELNAEPALQDESVLSARVAHHHLVRRRRAADVVDDVQEVHVLVLDGSSSRSHRTPESRSIT